MKDGNLLTSRGPSTALALAYALVEQFGGDAQSLRQGMLYQDVFGGCLKGSFGHHIFW